MDPDDFHTYPPGYPPIDPQYLQHLEDIFQSRIATIEKTFKEQLDIKRLEWSKQQQENSSQEVVLQNQIKELRLRLEQAELQYEDTFY